MGMTVIFFCSEASAMSLESFSRGNAGFGRSAANGTNFIGRGGNTGVGRYRSSLHNPKKGSRLITAPGGYSSTAPDQSNSEPLIGWSLARFPSDRLANF